MSLSLISNPAKRYAVEDRARPYKQKPPKVFPTNTGSNPLQHPHHAKPNRDYGSGAQMRIDSTSDTITELEIPTLSESSQPRLSPVYVTDCNGVRNANESVNLVSSQYFKRCPLCVFFDYRMHEAPRHWEHGIGTGKMKYLEKELGIENLRTMKRIKDALDPNNIMNPSKPTTHVFFEIAALK
ncbi:hypothetical protein HAX54_040297 [Datura stramonium]|uniref:FAD-binding oxidoreductase/transferase type 4 C-terminal domain-containing protein n=1 Tax=Datura stramonium TaxID=4076 RepID=A0ABS8VPA5_DATST|nr:hypothetical protein [Datura stramonium]